MGGVIVSVVVVIVVGVFGISRKTFQEVLHALGDFRRAVEARIKKAGDAGGRAGKSRTARSEHVGKTAVRLLGFFDIIDGAVDSAFGDFDAGVAGGAERHDLADGDGDIGVIGDGLVTPASFGVLRSDDKADGGLKFFLKVGARAHAVDFGQVERGKAMAVHGGAVVLGSDEARLLAVFEFEVEDFIDFLSVGAIIGKIAIGDEGDAGESHNGGGVSTGGVDGAVDIEIFGEVLKAFLDAGAEIGSDFIFDGSAADGGGL